MVIMPGIGGFTRSRNYAHRRRAMGRYRSRYQVGGTMFPPTMIPFFPQRAKPWELPWRIPSKRIKAVHRRKRRVKR